MSYGPNQSDMFRRAADLVDKVLRGEARRSPGARSVINLTAAKALGSAILRTLLARADQGSNEHVRSRLLADSVAKVGE